MERLELKKPTDKEISEEFNEKIINDYSSFMIFQMGIDFALKYNEEQRDILKIYNIGFNVDIKTINDLMQNNEWDDFNADELRITNVLDLGDTLKIHYDLKSDYGVHEQGLVITIDDKGRVFSDLGDTPWEGSGAHDEIEELLMSFVTKLKYD